MNSKTRRYIAISFGALISGAGYAAGAGLHNLIHHTTAAESFSLGPYTGGGLALGIMAALALALYYILRDRPDESGKMPAILKNQLDAQDAAGRAFG